MITLEKLKVFKKYRGFFDGYLMKKDNNKDAIVEGHEWLFLENLFQDYKLDKNGLISKKYLDKINSDLSKKFENQESVDFFLKLIDEDW